MSDYLDFLNIIGLDSRLKQIKKILDSYNINYSVDCEFVYFSIYIDEMDSIFEIKIDCQICKMCVHSLSDNSYSETYDHTFNKLQQIVGRMLSENCCQ